MLKSDFNKYLRAFARGRIGSSLLIKKECNSKDLEASNARTILLTIIIN